MCVRISRTRVNGNIYYYFTSVAKWKCSSSDRCGFTEFNNVCSRRVFNAVFLFRSKWFETVGMIDENRGQRFNSGLMFVHSVLSVVLPPIEIFIELYTCTFHCEWTDFCALTLYLWNESELAINTKDRVGPMIRQRLGS